MGNERITRPDSGTVRTMMETGSRIDAKLQEICASEEAQRRSARMTAQQLCEDRIREESEHHGN